MTDKRVVIAIDGPGGSGKSTVAKRVAQKLGFVYVSSGAIYRAVALWALRLHVDLTDRHRLEQLAEHADIKLDPQSGRIMLNGEDVSTAIRDPAVSDAASKIATVPGVRRALLPVQRAAAEDNNVVMEGRDIGSVVFPNAHVKIFLDANPAERARRRAAEIRSVAGVADARTVAVDLNKRDERDRRRAEAPLVQAADADLIDTTDLSIEQVEQRILTLIRARTSNGKAAAG